MLCDAIEVMNGTVQPHTEEETEGDDEDDEQLEARVGHPTFVLKRNSSITITTDELSEWYARILRGIEILKKSTVTPDNKIKVKELCEAFNKFLKSQEHGFQFSDAMIV